VTEFFETRIPANYVSNLGTAYRSQLVAGACSVGIFELIVTGTFDGAEILGKTVDVTGSRSWDERVHALDGDRDRLARVSQ
jgi:hypothetical protein